MLNPLPPPFSFLTQHQPPVADKGCKNKLHIKWFRTFKLLQFVLVCQLFEVMSEWLFEVMSVVDSKDR
jgi:hypothetical protein